MIPQPSVNVAIKKTASCHIEERKGKLSTNQTQDESSYELQNDNSFNMWSNQFSAANDAANLDSVKVVNQQQPQPEAVQAAI